MAEDTPKPDEPLSQATLQELLRQHEAEKKALREEFTDKEAEKDESVTEENARKRIIELAPDAWAALTYLVNNSDSDSVRASCAKYIMDVTLGKVKPADGGDDSIKKLIESLKPKSEASN